MKRRLPCCSEERNEGIDAAAKRIRADNHSEMAPTRPANTESADGTDIASYFRRRAAKLDEQSSKSASKPAIFAGCVFYVNTSAKDGLLLRQLIAAHGGSPWIMGPALSVITHIVAGTLTPAKVHSLIKRIGRKAVHAVTPAYIYACAEAGRRLPEVRYSCVADVMQQKLASAAEGKVADAPSAPAAAAGKSAGPAVTAAPVAVGSPAASKAGAEAPRRRKKTRRSAETGSRSWARFAAKLPSPNALCALSNTSARSRTGATAGAPPPPPAGHVAPAGAAPISGTSRGLNSR